MARIVALYTRVKSRFASNIEVGIGDNTLSRLNTKPTK